MAMLPSDKQNTGTAPAERVPFRLTGPGPVAAAAARRFRRLEALRSRRVGTWVAAVGDRARRRIGWQLPLTLVTGVLIMAAVGLSYRSQIVGERSSAAAGTPGPGPEMQIAGPPAAASTIPIMTSGTDVAEPATPESAPPARPGQADHGAPEPIDAGFLLRQWGPSKPSAVLQSDDTNTNTDTDTAPRSATTPRRSPASAVSTSTSPATTAPTTAAPATTAPTSAPTTAPTTTAPTTTAPTTAAPTTTAARTTPPTTRPPTTRPPTTPAPTTSPAPGPNCGLEGSIRSREGRTQLSFSITNQTGERLQVYWLDYGGKRVSYGGVSAANSMNRSSYRTHPWVVAYPDGTCALLIPDPADGQHFTVS